MSKPMNVVIVTLSERLQIWLFLVELTKLALK